MKTEHVLSQFEKRSKIYEYEDNENGLKFFHTQKNWFSSNIDDFFLLLRSFPETRGPTLKHYR